MLYSHSAGVLLHATPIHLQYYEQDMPDLRQPQPLVQPVSQLHDTMRITWC